MKRGRRTRLTPQLQRKICRLLERGHTVGTVCAALGLPDRSFHRYCARNAAFLAETQRARAKGRVRIVDSILDDRDWRGKAWYLERTAPAEFGRVAERELPLPEGQRQIGVTFVLNMPDGSQRQTSFEEAQKMFGTFPIKDTCEPAADERKSPPGPDSDSPTPNLDELGNNVDGDDSPC
jgi:hypothetical protein